MQKDNSSWLRFDYLSCQAEKSAVIRKITPLHGMNFPLIMLAAIVSSSKLEEPNWIKMDYNECIHLFLASVQIYLT